MSSHESDDIDELRRVNDHLRMLLAYLLPYAPEPTPSMAGGEYDGRYREAAARAEGAVVRTDRELRWLRAVAEAAEALLARGQFVLKDGTAWQGFIVHLGIPR